MNDPGRSCDRLTPREAAAELGIREEDLREAVQSGLLPTSDGQLLWDDAVAFARARRQLDSYPSLINEIAVIKVEQERNRQFREFLADLIGIQSVARAFTDEQLLDLYRLSKKKTGHVTTGSVSCLIPILLSITDRDLRRMDELTGESRSWRHLVEFTDGIVDKMMERKDLLYDERYLDLRRDLIRASSFLRRQAAFVLALDNPYIEPKELLGKICAAASRLDIRDRPTRRTDVRQSLEELKLKLSPGKPAAPGT